MAWWRDVIRSLAAPTEDVDSIEAEGKLKAHMAANGIPDYQKAKRIADLTAGLSREGKRRSKTVTRTMEGKPETRGAQRTDTRGAERDER